MWSMKLVLREAKQVLFSSRPLLFSKYPPNLVHNFHWLLDPVLNIGARGQTASFFGDLEKNQEEQPLMSILQRSKSWVKKQVEERFGDHKVIFSKTSWWCAPSKDLNCRNTEFSLTNDTCTARAWNRLEGQYLFRCPRAVYTQSAVHQWTILNHHLIMIIVNIIFLTQCDKLLLLKVLASHNWWNCTRGRSRKAWLGRRGFGAPPFSTCWKWAGPSVETCCSHAFQDFLKRWKILGHR